MQCFAVDGISGTSMADIIRASGLSSGAIYSHFDSKAELLRHVMAMMLEDRFTAVAAEPDGSATTVTPEVLLARLLAGPSANRAQTSVLVQVWGEMSRDEDLVLVAEENVAHLRALLVQTLTPWAVQRADADQVVGLTTRTADWLIAVTFGFATVLALQPAGGQPDFHVNLLDAARTIGDYDHRS